jgi:hypothetical protein
MLEAFERKIRDVQLRCSANLLLEQSAMALTTAGIISAFAVLIERLSGVEIISNWFAMLLAVICIAGVAVIYKLRQPSRMHAALLIDERLELKERFSTTIMIDGSEDPFARAAQNQARNHANSMRLDSHFPIRFSSRWYYTASSWAILFAIFIFLPQQDLFGYISKKNVRDQETIRREVAKDAIKKAATPIKLALKRLGDEGLSSDLAKLDPLMNRELPEDAKRQAIRKLGDISDKLKKLQATTKMESVEIAKQMMRQLKGTPQGLSQKLGMELAKGNFSKASDMLRQLQKQMEDGKLTDDQKKRLSKQLKDLATQLKDLAEKNGQLEKELAKMGLGKNLSKLSPKQLQQALQKKGLTSDQIKKLMKKASSCKSACNSCSQLGAAMASAGSAGAGGDQLSELMDQLNAMEAMSQQMQMAQASIDEISRAIGCLGKGMCQGGGCTKPWSAGPSNKWGKGSGGPGKGQGARETADGGKFSTKNTKVTSKTEKPGPIVASWYFKGEQVKGNAQRDYSAVVEAGRDSAAEAISENQIPRKYEDTVKKYFGGLQETTVE